MIWLLFKMIPLANVLIIDGSAEKSLFQNPEEKGYDLGQVAWGRGSELDAGHLLKVE